MSNFKELDFDATLNDMRKLIDGHPNKGMLSVNLFKLEMFMFDQQNKIEEYELAKRDLLLHTKRYLGAFSMVSGAMLVTDPCYERGSRWQYLFNNVKKGKWLSYLTYSDEGEWGIRVDTHVAYIGEEPNDDEWVKVEKVSIGVDSGTVGFFDDSCFVEREVNEDEYTRLCYMTFSQLQGGIADYGAISSSGYGDGAYPLYVVKRDGEVAAVKMNFLNDEDVD